MKLEGSCHCGAVRFSADTRAPYPYCRCYCSICRKTAGSGGFGIFIIARHETLQVSGEDNLKRYHPILDDGATSPAERAFCKHCGSHLWLWDPRWPTHLHPHASAIDTPLPRPPRHQDCHTASAAPWVIFHGDQGDRPVERLDGSYTVGMEDWHRQNGLLEGE